MQNSLTVINIICVRDWYSTRFCSYFLAFQPSEQFAAPRNLDLLSAGYCVTQPQSGRHDFQLLGQIRYNVSTLTHLEYINLLIVDWHLNGVFHWLLNYKLVMGLSNAKSSYNNIYEDKKSIRSLIQIL